MTLMRNLLVTAAAASGMALLAGSPVSAHTICRPDGVCFNTSGTPIPYWEQPAYRGYADQGYYPYPYRYHHRRHWRYYEGDRY